MYLERDETRDLTASAKWKLIDLHNETEQITEVNGWGMFHMRDNMVQNRTK